MRRHLILGYGIACYVVFFLTFLYSAGFLSNFAVPKAIDTGVDGSVGFAVLVNAALMLGFALQHSVMARPAFKRWWLRLVPMPAERSTYVLFSSLALIALFVFWQPMTQSVWSVENPAARTATSVLFVGGIGLVLYATFLIDHFDLFGLRQVFLYWNRRIYTHKNFTTPGPYRWIRHPLYVGWLVTMWATPDMTTGHLLFAGIGSAYIFAAIGLEERDLLDTLGVHYREYYERTPMMIPRIRIRSDRPIATATESR